MPGKIVSTQQGRVAGYFSGAAVQTQNFHVTDIPARRLTHIIYAFANVDSAGTCVSVNAAEDEVNFPQLLQLKQQHPSLQTLISVGGASHSANFPHAASTDRLRLHFATSCIQFMKENGLDGIDIDWEFPAAADTKSFTALLRELRSGLEAQSATDQRPYLLTMAAPAGPAHYSILELNLIHPFLDWINLMAYDFSVASSKVTDFVAPLEAYDLAVGNHAALNVDAAVQAYLRSGVPPEKVVLGTRFVGTGWKGVPNTNHGLYQRNQGPAKGTWDRTGAAPSGSFGYQDIKKNYFGKYSRNWHSEARVPWLYSAATGIMISYEDPESLALKANYALSNALGGVMIWELGADDAQHTLLDALTGGYAHQRARANRR